MSAWFLYLLTILDAVNIFAAATLFASIIGIIVCGLLLDDCYNDLDKTRYQKWLRRAIIVIPIALVPLVFVPSTRTAMVIVGVHYVSNVDELGELAPKAVKGLNKLLSSYLQSDDES